MAFVVTRPCRIGGWREPGEVLTADELRGRNVRHMEDVDRCIRFDPTIPEPSSSKRTVEAAESEGDGDSGEDLSALSLKDLKAKAAEVGVENADALKSKAAAIEADQRRARRLRPGDGE